MEAYKQALQLGIRFNTTLGLLSTEQLFQLKQGQLETAIRNQKKLLKKNDEDDLGFLDTDNKVDKTEQLKFDILKDVYLTKKAENEAARLEKETKENNEKILALLEKKRESKLESMSEEELLALLK